MTSSRDSHPPPASSPRAARSEPAWEVTPAEVRAMLDAPETPGSRVLLVDCRTPEEHALARIEGAALIPLHDLASRLPEIDGHEGPIVVYCHHGVRSLQAVALLRREGLGGAASMAGGIDRWSIEVDPRVPRY